MKAFVRMYHTWMPDSTGLNISRDSQMMYKLYHNNKCDVNGDGSQLLNDLG